jgi:hypothetical protein
VETLSEMPVNWRKSSFSWANGDCVEVSGSAFEAIWIRDSKNPQGHALAITPAGWNSFLGDIGDGALSFRC